MENLVASYLTAVDLMSTPTSPLNYKFYSDIEFFFLSAGRQLLIQYT